MYRVQYYPRCQASTANLEIYPLWIRGDCCTRNSEKKSPLQAILMQKYVNAYSKLIIFFLYGLSIGIFLYLVF